MALNTDMEREKRLPEWSGWIKFNDDLKKLETKMIKDRV